MRHIPRKRFGQHFLVDPAVIQAIIQAIDPQAGDSLIEIGPGLGALTEPLLKQVDHLTVIEIDRDLIAAWKKRYPADRLKIIAGDVLNIEPAQLGTHYRLIGNLPYNISTPLLIRLCDRSFDFIDAHFMLQKEVIDRIVAEPGSKTYGRLSVMMQTYFEVEALFDVMPTAFDPPPKVVSAVIRLTPTDRYCQQLKAVSTLEGVVRQAFSQRRKTVSNTLKGLLSREDLIALDLDPGARAETLSIEDFIRMANYCHSLGSE